VSVFVTYPSFISRPLNYIHRSRYTLPR